MTREFKVGDKVFDIRHGNGVVTEMTLNSSWPVNVKFVSSLCENYTLEGKDHAVNLGPTLFHGHDLIIEVKEPEYEWQILSKLHDSPFELSTKFYKSLEPYLYANCSYANFSYENVELFEPSKRLVKRG